MADSCADFEDEVGSGARRPESSTPVGSAGMQAWGRATAPAPMMMHRTGARRKRGGKSQLPAIFPPPAHAALGLSPQSKAGGGRPRVQASEGAAAGPTAQEGHHSSRLPPLGFDATRRLRSPGLPLRRS